MTLRFPVEPMRAALGRLPPDDEGWAYELKYDGYRTLAFVDGGKIRLQSSHLLDVTLKWPEVGDLPSGVHAESAILDGELVVLDDLGRPRFELIQRHERQAALYVFDVLSVDGNETIGLPYEDRRRLLGQLVEPGPNWAVPGHRVGGGGELLEATVEQGLEGVMAKRLGSTYQPGRRTPNWIKVKNRIQADVVIGGYTAGTGNRSSSFGALLVGVPRDGRLAFAGGVGTGFNQRTLESLLAELRALRTDRCPFEPEPPREYRRGATWVRPDLSARIELTEFTNDGFVRQASFLQLV
jgi:bifunctional non-homologous end joining protein LigD